MSDVIEKKGRLGKWQPKKWKADYDRVVGYHVLGKPNVEIALMIGMTPEHISTILNLPRAQELKLQLERAMRDRMLTNIPDTLEYIARKTTERLKSIVDNDDIFDKSPFAVVRMGMEVMKGVGHLKGGGNGAPQAPSTISIQNAVFANGEVVNGLLSGLNKADEARRINATPTTAITERSNGSDGGSFTE